MLSKPDISKLDSRDAFDLAILVESTAEERYAELAVLLENHSTREPAEFLNHMAARVNEQCDALRAWRHSTFGDTTSRLAQSVSCEIPTISHDAVRAFIAIELSEAVRLAIREFIDEFRKCGVRASWVKPENLHLTLRFLGDVDEATLAGLGNSLARAYRGTEPFCLEVAGAGCFPNPRRPSVLWVGVPDAPEALWTVQGIAEAAARECGLKAEAKTYKPHITVARIRDSRGGESFSKRLDEAHAFRAGEFSVQSMSLFSSTLTPTGAIYLTLRKFPF